MGDLIMDVDLTIKEGPRKAILHSRDEKIWIYRTIALHAKVGFSLTHSLVSISTNIRKRMELASPAMENAEAVLRKLVDNIDTVDKATNACDFFESQGFVFDIKETPFLDFPLNVLDDAKQRYEIFSTLADILSE